MLVDGGQLLRVGVDIGVPYFLLILPQQFIVLHIRIHLHFDRSVV